MRTVNNRAVVRYALTGQDAKGYGAVSTDHYREGFTRYGAPYQGSLPRGLAKILDARFREGAISQVVYSYSTPIAWKDNGVWIQPDVSYSNTSAKHQSYLWVLNTRAIPRDASEEEYTRVRDGLMTYVRPRTRGGFGSYIPG